MKPATVFLLVVLGASAPAPRARATDGDDAKAAAREHFDKGLAALNEQRFGAAAEEFEAAYRLSPDFKVLYNLGRVDVMLGRSVEAADAFEAYLDQGGALIAIERREEVRRFLDELLPRIASVGVTTETGADVRVDGRLVGRAPLAKRIRVAAGKHTLEALLPARAPLLRELVLAGASTTDVTLTFPAPPETPRIAITPPAANPPEDRSFQRRLGYVMAGAGLLATAGGIALAFDGADTANGARARLIEAAMPAPPGVPDVMKYDAARRTYEDAKTRNQLGWTIAALGGALVVTGGIVVYAAHHAQGRGATTTISLAAQPGGVVLGGRW